MFTIEWVEMALETDCPPNLYHGFGILHNNRQVLCGSALESHGYLIENIIKYELLPYTINTIGDI
jgi:hypothetical protein